MNSAYFITGFIQRCVFYMRSSAIGVIIFSNNTKVLTFLVEMHRDFCTVETKI